MHYLHRIGNTNMDLRKARTRTLIQLGGLLEKSGILDDINLAPGDDLQKDSSCFDSVAILMGALCELRQNFHTDDAPAQKILWCERGKEMLGAK
jgi:hypothetical protein